MFTTDRLISSSFVSQETAPPHLSLSNLSINTAASSRFSIPKPSPIPSPFRCCCCAATGTLPWKNSIVSGSENPVIRQEVWPGWKTVSMIVSGLPCEDEEGEEAV